MEYQKKHLLWIVGLVAASVSGLLMTLAYHFITWAPMLVEIASVTWNDGPAL